MLRWTKYQERNNGVHNNFEKKRPTQELILACNQIMTYIKQNKIPFGERPLISDHYAESIKQHEIEHGSLDVPLTQLSGWFNDPKYKRAMSLPIREISYVDLPDEITQPAFDALAEQEKVYERAMIFRVIKLEPGDNVLLHYDPRTFYTPDKQWQQGHQHKYIDKRAFIYMHDRMPGQISYLGNREIDYKQYDMFVFDVNKVYHGACNFGYDDRYMICYSWAEPI